MINFLYFFISFSLFISGLLLITYWNPIYKIIFFILLFFFGSSLFLLLDFYFLGLTYFIVYIGAITILFLFIIMMVPMNETQIDLKKSEKNQIFFILNFLLFLLFISFYHFNHFDIYNYFYNQWTLDFLTLTDIEFLGEFIFLSYPLTFILISYLLWLILIGILWITL